MTDLVWIVSSCVMIAVVLVLRAVFGRRMSAGLRYALWALVLIRLLVPGTVLQSPVSVKTAVSRTEAAQNLEITKDFSSVARSGEDDMIASFRDGRETSLLIRDVAPEKLEGYKKAIEVRDVLRVVWYTGMGLMSAYMLYVNIRFYLKLRDRRSRVRFDAPCRVYAVNGIESSCLFLNTVYVSKETADDPEKLACVIAHELSHRRHGDGVFTLLRCAALAVHWYNPLVWLAAFASRQDSELFADAGAIKALGEKKREDYGRTLIELSRRPSVRASIACTATTMANNKRALRERVTNVAKARRTGIIIGAAVLLTAALAVGCTFLGSAKAEESGSALPDATAAPETTDAPDPGACPFDEADHQLIWAFLETADKYGVKNGAKLFPNYDPADPASWERKDDDGRDETFFLWTEDGRLSAISLLDRNRSLGEGPTLVGTLELDGLPELRSVMIMGCVLDSFSADNCPKLEETKLSCARNEVLFRLDSGYKGYYLVSRFHLHAESTGKGMFAPDKANYTVDLRSDGNCFVALSAYDDDHYVVNASAIPLEGYRFVGWYDRDNRLVSADAQYELSDRETAGGLNGEFSLIARAEPLGPVIVPEDDWFIDRAWSKLEEYVLLYRLPFTKDAASVTVSELDPPKNASVFFEGGDGWTASVSFELGEDREWTIWNDHLWQEEPFTPEERDKDREFIRLLDFTGSVTKAQLEANGYSPTQEGAEKYASDRLAKQFIDCPANNLFHCSDAAVTVSPGDWFGDFFPGDNVRVLLRPDNLGAFIFEFSDIFECYYPGGDDGEYRGYYVIGMFVQAVQSGDTFTYSFHTGV